MSALGGCVGAVVGLVPITAVGFVDVGQSVLIDVAAAVASNAVVHWKSKSTLDDTLDVCRCHSVGGIVWMLATGLFAKDVDLIHGTPRTFLVHLAALVRSRPSPASTRTCSTS